MNELNTVKRLPDLVIAADWSVEARKRWMVRAELIEERRYRVFPPEPVGEVTTLIERIRLVLPSGGTGLMGFDFAMGLPRKYAEKTGLSEWRTALKRFGSGRWARFYERSDRPSLFQPFFPEKLKKGKLRAELAGKLGVGRFSELLRRCDKKTKNGPAAECLFFTLGSRQVGAGAIVGWKYVLAPGLKTDDVFFWPFDGGLAELVSRPGLVVAEIYPAEACVGLGVSIGPGTGRKKTRRSDRRYVSEPLLDTFRTGDIVLSEAAKSWFRWGFVGDDDFDAMMGLLSMLLMVTGRQACGFPHDDPWVTGIEGWIMGRSFE